MKTVVSIFVFLFIIDGVLDVDPDGLKTVREGESLTLKTDFIEMQKDGLIEWKVNDTSIATINRGTGKVEYNDVKLMEMFSDRLNLAQTGFLTIWNIKIKHSGEYKVEGSSSVGTKSMTFKVIVKESPLEFVEDEDEIKTLSVTKGNSETLHTDTELQKHDLILWRFGAEGSLIAKSDLEDNITSYYDGAEGRFRDRLNIDSKTGSLTITNINTEHVGEYQLKISGRKNSFKRFTVTVFVSYMSPGPVAGIVVVLLLAAATAAAGVIYWRYKNSELTKLKDLLKQHQLLKISKELEQLLEISEHLKKMLKIPGKELPKSSKKELLKMSDKLKKMSDNSENELLKISEHVEQLREDKFSERLLNISEHLKKMCADATKEERARSEIAIEGCIYVQETAISQAIGRTRGANKGFNPTMRKSLVIRTESVKRPPNRGPDGNVPGNELKDLKADSTEKGANDETPLMSQNEDDGMNDQQKNSV